MKISTIAVVVIAILSACAAMAQPNSATGTVPVRIIVCPEWAAKTWFDGIRDGNIHGRGTDNLAPDAHATRAESWAFGVAAAKQSWRDNERWLLPLLVVLAVVLIVVALYVWGLRDRVRNLERNSALDDERINALEARSRELRELLTALASRPVTVNINGPLVRDVSATASPTVSAEGGMGGTANLANGQNAIAGRVTETVTKTVSETPVILVAGGPAAPPDTGTPTAEPADDAPSGDSLEDIEDESAAGVPGTIPGDIPV